MCTPNLGLARFFFRSQNHESHSTVIRCLGGIQRQLCLRASNTPLCGYFRHSDSASVNSSLCRLVAEVTYLIRVHHPLCGLGSACRRTTHLIGLVGLVFRRSGVVGTGCDTPTSVGQRHGGMLCPLFVGLGGRLRLLLPELRRSSRIPRLLGTIECTLGRFPYLLGYLGSNHLSLSGGTYRQAVHTVTGCHGGDFFINDPRKNVHVTHVGSVFTGYHTRNIGSCSCLYSIFHEVNAASGRNVFSLLIRE